MVNIMNNLSFNTIIDYNNYTISLINHCYKNKIISYEEMNKIYNKLLDLLYYKCMHYNSGLISTVKVNILKNINDSNMFTLNLYLKEFNIYDGISLLLNNEIISLYNKSYSKLIEYVNKTKMFYKIIFLKNIIKTNNYYYNSTLKEGIKSFFKLYNSSYYSDRLIISVDYECALGRLNFNGIEFINKYLEYINYENIYCKCFNYEKIDMMLKMKYINYENIVINIFSDVFLVSLLLRYLDKDIYSLNIDDIDLDILYNDIKDKEFFKDKLYISFISIKRDLFLDDNVNKYLDKYYYKFYKTILYFTCSKELEKLLGKNSVVII